MAINDWPEQERPREKLLRQGATALTDAELLAIFLRTGVVGKSAIDLGRDLLHHFGSLREQRRWHVQSERLGGFEIDDQLELTWLHNWQMGGLCAF